MSEFQYIDDDFVKVYPNITAEKIRSVDTIVFGDQIQTLEGGTDSWLRVKYLHKGGWEWREGYIKRTTRLRDRGVLKFSMVDVQQGDGMVIETPEGKIVLIDGGENKMFARHLAARFHHKQSTADQPLEVEAIIVTHGDADHFAGLSAIRDSELGKDEDKRIFIAPSRIFHNGLLKRTLPSKKKAKDGVEKTQPIDGMEAFGRSAKIVGNESLGIIDLHDNFLEVPDEILNDTFKKWRDTLKAWQDRSNKPILVKRIAHGMDAQELFDFLHREGIKVQILGPFEDKSIAEDGNEVPSLRHFSAPRNSKPGKIKKESTKPPKGSASHTINGHSIALRLQFGNVRFGFTGDMNQESMELMHSRIKDISLLEAEIVKAPHHGSEDFDREALLAMKPVVALVSSGDDNVGKDHIHPRANLMAALGKSMRDMNGGILLTTELTAFFAYQQDCFRKEDILDYLETQTGKAFTSDELKRIFKNATRVKKLPNGKDKTPQALNSFIGFERRNFGIIHIRTDGRRVLVFTFSSKLDFYEDYRFLVNENHEVTWVDNWPQ